jgi:hypothetical protein
MTVGISNIYKPMNCLFIPSYPSVFARAPILSKPISTTDLVFMWPISKQHPRPNVLFIAFFVYLFIDFMESTAINKTSFNSRKNLLF